METPQRSSFVKRTLSKEDVIIQIFRPRKFAQVNQALDILDREVTSAEDLVALGTKETVAGIPYRITPEDFEKNLDEFEEIRQIAKLGREFLSALGYVSRRKNNPMAGNAPVGKNVEVLPTESQTPGEEPLSGAVIRPIPR